uniref:exosporium leader peptide-containing protein n=1 Tax=Bacillus albus TaxID=2026189 RepID=UPI001FB8B07A
MNEFLSSTSINSNLVGPTLPPIPPFTLPTGPTGLQSVAYGTFWQTEFITVPFGAPFSFNQAEPLVGGVSLLNPPTINITQPGDYRISFISSINLTVPLTFTYQITFLLIYKSGFYYYVQA